MQTMFSQYTGVEVFFLICAVVGGIFVLFKLIMQFMGLDHDHDGSLPTDSHDICGHHSDSDVGFKVLSLQGVISFLMMFGLVGLALHRESQVGILSSMAGAIAAGIASVWIIKAT